jgi:hypothetical protein
MVWDKKLHYAELVYEQFNKYITDTSHEFIIRSIYCRI